MMNWNPRREMLNNQPYPHKPGHHLAMRVWLGTIVALAVLAFAWVEPVFAQAQAIGPVYALPGTMTPATNRSYATILTIANGTQYGLVGQNPDIEAQIVQFRAQGEDFEVKVWGDRFPAVVENDLQYIVVSSIQPADLATPTPEATAAPTDAPTAAPTAAPTEATPVVPVAVVTAASVNVRSGPGTEYPRAGGVVAGDTCAVIGRNQGATWWQLSCPSASGWVLGDLLALAGPISTVPVVQTAPPPTPAPPTTFANWKSTFFANRNLSGSPVLTVDQPNVNFNWGFGSPAENVPSDNFSARFERTLNFSYGTYELALTMDDGARLYIDDVIVIDAWNEASVRTRSTQLLLSGSKRIRVEYFEATGMAQIQFSVNLISSSEAWTASYYRGKGFRTEPVLTRGEPRSNNNQLNYNWGRGSPVDGVVPVDEFSARWVGRFHFEGGDYRFSATTDDGIRVYIDGILILDRWLNGYHADVTNTFRGLGAGNHTITVEYYESFGDALVRLRWERISGGGGGGGGDDDSGRPRAE